MWLHTLLFGGTYLGSSILSAKENRDFKKDTYTLPNGVKYWYDRKGTMRTMNDTAMYTDYKGNFYTVNGTLLYSAEAEKKSEIKKQAVETVQKAKYGGKKYALVKHHLIDERDYAVEEVSTGKILGHVGSVKENDGKRHYYITYMNMDKLEYMVDHIFTSPPGYSQLTSECAPTAYGFFGCPRKEISKYECRELLNAYRPPEYTWSCLPYGFKEDDKVLECLRYDVCDESGRPVNIMECNGKEFQHIALRNETFDDLLNRMNVKFVKKQAANETIYEFKEQNRQMSAYVDANVEKPLVHVFVIEGLEMYSKWKEISDCFWNAIRNAIWYEY